MMTGRATQCEIFEVGHVRILVASSLTDPLQHLGVRPSMLVSGVTKCRISPCPRLSGNPLYSIRAPLLGGSRDLRVRAFTPSRAQLAACSRFPHGPIALGTAGARCGKPPGRCSRRVSEVCLISHLRVRSRPNV
jgi:hypothetical protein